MTRVSILSFVVDACLITSSQGEVACLVLQVVRLFFFRVAVSLYTD